MTAHFNDEEKILHYLLATKQVFCDRTVPYCLNDVNHRRGEKENIVVKIQPRGRVRYTSDGGQKFSFGKSFGFFNMLYL